MARRMIVLFTSPVRAASSARDRDRSPFLNADSTVRARSAEATPSSAGRRFPLSTILTSGLSSNLGPRLRMLQPRAQDAPRLALGDEQAATEIGRAHV